MLRRPLLPLLLAALAVLLPRAAAAVWAPEGVDLTRPRLLFRPGDVPAIQAKLDVQPTPPWLDAVLDRMEAHIAEGAAAAADPDLDQRTKEAQRLKGRAARNLAFLYAVNRTRVNGVVVPFASEAERQAVGETVRDYLDGMYTASRLAVAPPIGGWDRDISSSEELVNWATAYDTLKGAGFDLTGYDNRLERKIALLASHLYENYVDPVSATNFAEFHKNNHRSKVGASLVVAAIAIAEHDPAPTVVRYEYRDPADWVEYGFDQFDDIVRIGLNAGDGGYAEGPFYFRFTSQNLVPFARAWDRLLGGAGQVSFGEPLPSFWRHPLFERMQRWMLDMTLPDGSLVHIDDGNPGRSHYFGALPPDLPGIAGYYWRWANAPTPYEIDGNIDLGPDAIVLYDPSVVPAPPDGSPTAFYPEGGNAIFRSDWSADAVVAVALGEYDTSSLLCRNRHGRPLIPQGHEHPDAGSFLLHAFGERLALDPGYLSFEERANVAGPEHHNMILVDGEGPYDPVRSTLDWVDHDARPPADGHGRISHTLDTAFLDAARVTTSYGFQLAAPVHTAPLIRRRFLFPDHRYLVVADRVESRDGAAHELAWLLHGHGGGTDPGGAAGGTYAHTAAGGRWERGAARLDSAFALDAGVPAFTTQLSAHESILSKDEPASHVALRATASGEALSSVMLVYPSRSADAAPTATALPTPDVATAVLEDAAGDRRVLAWHRAAPGDPLALPAADTGLADAESDGRLALFDAHADGTLRMAYGEGATRLVYDGTTWLETARRGFLAVAPGAGRVEYVVDARTDEVTLPSVPFAPARVDGACSFTDHGDGRVTVALTRERRFALDAAAGNARPAADPGPDLRLPYETTLQLDGSASCDADGDALTPRWRLLSAPTRHRWTIDGADTWTPTLVADQLGVYRLELVVTDEHGLESLPNVVVVHRGWPCDDGVDDDLDGVIDSDDPSCRYKYEELRYWGEGCGLGPELAPLLAVLARRRRRNGS